MLRRDHVPRSTSTNLPVGVCLSSGRCCELNVFKKPAVEVIFLLSHCPTSVKTWHRLSSSQVVGLTRFVQTMESQINMRQSMLEKMKIPFNKRRLNRYWHSFQLNMTRNSGYYALVSSLMCLCLIGLRSNSDYHDHDEIDPELHYSFHSWEPKVLINKNWITNHHKDLFCSIR